MAPHIFVSHSFEDEVLAHKIKEELKELDLECYLAEDNPQYGNALSDKIAKAIDSCEIVLVVLTRNGSSSASVNQEIGYAKKSRKLIIPLVEEGVDVSLFTIDKEYASFNSENEDDAINDVTKYVKAQLKEQFGNDWMLVLAVVLVILSLVLAVYYKKKQGT